MIMIVAVILFWVISIVNLVFDYRIISVFFMLLSYTALLILWASVTDIFAKGMSLKHQYVGLVSFIFINFH